VAALNCPERPGDGAPVEQPTYVLDGARIQTLEDFWSVIGEAVNGPGGYFASNLDALDDSLTGGMGQPDDGRCTFIFRHADQARQALGYPETVQQLQLRLERCHPTNRTRVAEDLRRAQSGEGPTVFEWLLEAFEGSPPNSN
jgi:RNAse (barnase) inhibitor barstar